MRNTFKKMLAISVSIILLVMLLPITSVFADDLTLDFDFITNVILSVAAHYRTQMVSLFQRLTPIHHIQERSPIPLVR
ncbi:MAG: hypothetical protein KAQ68_01135 [Clostridiales bacterium]|nr:hypothetical protein [Clostridiales bacterium]